MGALDGGFDLDVAQHVDELSDLAAYAGVALTRDGDWLTVSTDLRGDPTWSEQAEEFYRSLSGFVREGQVNLRAQDGSTWSYQYSAGGVERSRTQPADAPASSAGTAPPETPGPATQPVPEASPEPGPEPEPDDFIDYPGREPRPDSPAPSAPSEPPASPVPYAERPPDGPPQSYREMRLPDDDDARPSAPGRALLMTVVLIVGVLLIIGLALLVSGF